MHVPSNPVPRAPRLPLAAAVIAMFAGVAGSAHAVEFDEKLKAPMSQDAAQLRSRTQAFSDHDAQARVAGFAALVRNRQLSQERFDVSWQVQRAIDDKRPLGDLSGQGIVDRGDGTFGVDLSAYPQWGEPADHLASLLSALNPSLLGAELARRGMKPEDQAKLQEFLAAHAEKAATGAAALPIGVSFSRIVGKYDKLKRPVPDSLVLSYVYQRERATTEARRAWAESLLDAIGPGAARILESYFSEMKETAVWGPSDTRAGIDGLLANLRMPDFEQKLAAEANGVSP